MNEQQRTAYLEAMGIQVFVPRWTLPAARPSRQAPLPEPVQSHPSSQALGNPDFSQSGYDESNGSEPGYGASGHGFSHRETSNPAARNLTGMLSGIINQLEAKGSSHSKLPPASPAEPAASPAKRVLDVLAGPAPSEGVRFSLSLWRATEGLMVIDSHQARQALPTSTLLNNMLFAKGWRMPLARPEVLNWPMVGGTDDGGWPQACEMVQAFLNARCERQPVQSIWLMGEAAYRAVCDGSDDYQKNIGHMRDLPTLGCLAVVLPSLTDMLKSPSLKAPAWQAIKEQKIV